MFSTEELAPYVFLAAERVARERYGVRVPPAMRVYAKQDDATLNPIRAELEAAGYYESAPADLRPVPHRLTRGDITARVTAVQAELAKFDGVSGGSDDERKVVVDTTRIRHWLAQFRDYGIIDAALTVLEAVRIVGRAELRAALRTFFTDNHEFRGAWLCPLGAAKDSSGVIAYYASDVAQSFDCRVGSITDALASDGPLVFVDDFVGSGAQAITILENWLGVEPIVDLHEDRGQPLREELQAELRTRELALVYSAGMQEGADAIEARAADLGLRLKVRIGIPAEELPRVTGGGVLEQPQEAAFLSACEEIGSALLLDPEVGHDEDWVAQRRLGYGNHSFLVAFPYNTPAQTLTCLWAGGQYNGAEWFPLLPRRKKV